MEWQVYLPPGNKIKNIHCLFIHITYNSRISKSNYNFTFNWNVPILVGNDYWACQETVYVYQWTTSYHHILHFWDWTPDLSGEKLALYHWAILTTLFHYFITDERQYRWCSWGSNHSCRSCMLRLLGSKMSYGSLWCCWSWDCCGSDDEVTTESVCALDQDRAW